MNQNFDIIIMVGGGAAGFTAINIVEKIKSSHFTERGVKYSRKFVIWRNL
jgi:predicted flavoprotein YhiN